MDELYRLSLFSPMSIKIPNEVYELVVADAWRFHYVKNGKSNISGFLNDLIPSMVKYKEDSFCQISSITKLEDDLLKPYINAAVSLDYHQLSLIKDSGTNITFRINKSRINDFIDIYDKHLSAFNISFSSLVRNSLTEFATKRLLIRERLAFFKQFKQIAFAIQEQQSCFTILKDTTIHFLPLKIITSPFSDLNTIFGINIPEKKIISIPLCNIIAVSHKENRLTVSDNVRESLQHKIDLFFNDEKNKIK